MCLLLFANISLQAPSLWKPHSSQYGNWQLSSPIVFHGAFHQQVYYGIFNMFDCMQIFLLKFYCIKIIVTTKKTYAPFNLHIHFASSSQGGPHQYSVLFLPVVNLPEYPEFGTLMQNAGLFHLVFADQTGLYIYIYMHAACS